MKIGGLLQQDINKEIKIIVYLDHKKNKKTDQ